MERDFHDWLKQHLPSDSRLLLPLGDDAAVLDWSSHSECVVTSDMLADGVHFRLDEVGPERAGRKSLAVSLSDVAAMAATPVAAVVSLFLPRGEAPRLAEQIVEGMLPLATEFQTVIAGGDTNVWDGELVINVTLLAVPATKKGVLRRDGAVPGDLLLVTGQLGGSIAGHHLDFQPRIQLARALHADYDIHAGMDLSDGLATDARRMAEQSQCGVEIRTAKLPLSEAALQLAADPPGRTAIERALADGEDFELLLAVPPDAWSSMAVGYRGAVAITEIGRVIEQPGVWCVNESGDREPCRLSGYEHR